MTAKRSSHFSTKEWAQRNIAYAAGVQTIVVHADEGLFWNGLFFSQL